MTPPYAAGAPRTATAKTSHDLFAADVYREEAAARREASDAVGDEIARLRSELRGETRALRSKIAKPAVPAELMAELAALRAAVDELLVPPKRGDAISAAIRARGIEGAAASALARAAKAKDRAASGAGGVDARLRASVPSVVKTAPWPSVLTGKGKGVIALVGPAGVGKTTTAAKLAARARMQRRSVAFVACDSFRVGAVDQLAAYADLMGARFHLAMTQDELLAIIAAETADVVIVDTAGRAIMPDATEAALASPELRAVTRSGRSVDVLLCVPAHLRAADATRVHRDFALVRPTALAVTKLDETDTPAGVVHAAFATRVPVRVLTAGQRVPEDIDAATDETVAARLFPPGADAASREAEEASAT